MLGKERRAYLLLRKDITYFFLLLKFYTKVEIDKVIIAQCIFHLAVQKNKR